MNQQVSITRVKFVRTIYIPMNGANGHCNTQYTALYSHAMQQYAMYKLSVNYQYHASCQTRPLQTGGAKQW